MTGRIHSVQSLGTVDGPGVRCVVFFQGCPLRCVCCHNPDTWDFKAGEEISADRLVSKIERFRPYFGENGGVTVSGGEPLMQPLFLAELFEKLKNAGFHTALDTSGCRMDAAVEKVLDHTDMVLLDHKYATDEEYVRYCGARLADVERFLTVLEQRRISTWLRRVIIPDINDTPESVRSLNRVARRYSCVRRIELLPFRNLCREKYDMLKIPFALADTPAPSNEMMDRLYAVIDEKYH